MTGHQLVYAHLGDAAGAAIATLDLDALLDGPAQTAMAAALNVILFHNLVARVPSAAAYVAERRAAAARIRFDHGALRTIRFPDGPTGGLPPGEQAFTRILTALGYQLAGVYPLPKLRMTGRAYAHAAHPEEMPQFFLSELHVEQFDAAFGEAAQAVFGSSQDPLSDAGKTALGHLAGGEALSADAASALLAEIVAAFDRQHEVPALSAYEALRAQSAEAAWIATEGNAFNHATDRVPDLEALVADERAKGRPIKDSIEVSRSGRVRQTAHRAALVSRPFIDGEGATVMRDVPGSFYEFIARDIDPATGRLDLAFDAGNATGIFAMTRDQP